MNHATPRAQRGISLFGLLFVGIVIALLAIVAAKVTPTVSEYLSVQKVVRQVASQSHDTPADVRAAFDRAASVQYITSISGKDLDVTRSGSRNVIRFAYDKEIALVGPTYLLIKYRGSSDRR